MRDLRRGQAGSELARVVSRSIPLDTLTWFGDKQPPARTRHVDVSSRLKSSRQEETGLAGVPPERPGAFAPAAGDPTATTAAITPLATSTASHDALLFFICTPLQASAAKLLRPG